MTFEIESFTAKDGVTLRCGINRAENARDFILILQGRGEYIERYQETADDLAKRGFGCVTFDFRGHGGSTRETSDRLMGYVSDLADYVFDTHEVISWAKNTHDIECKTLLTHSTGGLVGMGMMLEQPGLCDTAIMIAPFFGLGGPEWVAIAAQFLSGGLCRYGFDKQYLPGQSTLSPLVDFDPDNILTSDPERYMRNVEILKSHPDLVVGGVSAGWLDACFKAQAALDETLEAAENSLPPLPPISMVLAGNDQVVSNRVTEDLFGKYPNISITEIPEARHEILQERDIYRDQFWQVFDRHMAQFGPGQYSAET
jgi:lysophospholipase